GGGREACGVGVGGAVGEQAGGDRGLEEVVLYRQADRLGGAPQRCRGDRLTLGGQRRDGGVRDALPVRRQVLHGVGDGRPRGRLRIDRGAPVRVARSLLLRSGLV